MCIRDSLHRVAVLRQEPPQEPDEPGVILDDQQVHEISSAREGAFVTWVPSGRDEGDVRGSDGPRRGASTSCSGAGARGAAACGTGAARGATCSTCSATEAT